MNEQLIEKLKNNRIPWKWMDDESRHYMTDIVGVSNMVCLVQGKWVGLKCIQSDSVIVRIHKDYKTTKKIANYDRVDNNLEDKLNELIDAVNTLMEEK